MPETDMKVCRGCGREFCLCLNPDAPRDTADYGPVGIDPPESAVCRNCGRWDDEHTPARFSIAGRCPEAPDA